jgi:hypothetical protein
MPTNDYEVPINNYSRAVVRLALQSQCRGCLTKKEALQSPKAANERAEAAQGTGVAWLYLGVSQGGDPGGLAAIPPSRTLHEPAITPQPHTLVGNLEGLRKGGREGPLRSVQD